MSEQTSFCHCLACGQRFEYPTVMGGQEIQCPTCDQTTLLMARARPGAMSAKAPVDQTSGCGGCLLTAMVLFVVAAGIGSCFPSAKSTSSYSSTQSDLESKERSLERGDRLIYGDIRVESKEDIEKAAKEWQKEEKEGIGQHY